MNDLGPELLKGHAAVRRGNKVCCMFWGQNNDSAMADALTSSIVGNGRKMVDSGSQGGVGSMVIGVLWMEERAF